ncbi:MAG TPA: hypothetical protein VFL83_10795 [Anaeromyxobacter sp.]|nr:hypothetical protein [Anaeromyxobacter sp.]
MIRVKPSVALACLLLAAPAGAAGPSTGARTPDQEKLEAAADNIARMKTALKTVLARAEQARNEKDVVKLNCVNEKLTQIKALLKVAEQADIALHESLASRQGAGEAEFSKVAITRTKVDRLRREAEECIGQLAYMVDEKTTVEVEQPSGLPGREEGGLGVANRMTNPADLVAQIGGGDADLRRRHGPWFDPPPIIRPPAASRWR